MNGEDGHIRGAAGWLDKLRFAVPVVVLLIGFIVIATPEDGAKPARVPILATAYLLLAAALYFGLTALRGRVAPGSVRRAATRTKDAAVAQAVKVREAHEQTKAGNRFAGIVILENEIV